MDAQESQRVGPRPALVGAAAVVVLVAAITVLVGVRAIGSDATPCERFAADSRTRASIVAGQGDRVVVIGDSWSAGLGLDEIEQSWPSRLTGRVEVAGFSGSGFSAHASGCGRAVSFAERASGALGSGIGSDLVVVEGGLNDVDQPDEAIRRGVARLLDRLRGHRVVIVGPASAPARGSGVTRVDELLARLAASHQVPYVRTMDLDLSYLPDGLHLTPSGHQDFGDYVAAQLATRGIS